MIIHFPCVVFSWQMLGLGQYESAKMSFERAGDHVNALLAEGGMLRNSAVKKEGTDPKEAARLFRAAAECFLKCHKGKEAGGCYHKAGNPEKAGEKKKDL